MNWKIVNTSESGKRGPTCSGVRSKCERACATLSNQHIHSGKREGERGIQFTRTEKCSKGCTPMINYTFDPIFSDCMTFSPVRVNKKNDSQFHCRR